MYAMHTHNHITISGKTIALDDDGFVANPNDWSPQVSEYFSVADGVLLTEEHWQVIQFARDYYRTFGIGPMPKVIVKMLNRQLGYERYVTVIMIAATMTVEREDIKPYVVI